MAHYDNERGEIVYREPQKSEIWPAWDKVDCGCCAGIEWGGFYPRECRRCGGSGFVFKHRKSGVEAEYPGGRFC